MQTQEPTQHFKKIVTSHNYRCNTIESRYKTEKRHILQNLGEDLERSLNRICKRNDVTQLSFVICTFTLDQNFLEYVTCLLSYFKWKYKKEINLSLIYDSQIQQNLKLADITEQSKDINNVQVLRDFERTWIKAYPFKNPHYPIQHSKIYLIVGHSSSEVKAFFVAIGLGNAKKPSILGLNKRVLGNKVIETFLCVYWKKEKSDENWKLSILGGIMQHLNKVLTLSESPLIGFPLFSLHKKLHMSQTNLPSLAFVSSLNGSIFEQFMSLILDVRQKQNLAGKKSRAHVTLISPIIRKNALSKLLNRLSQEFEIQQVQIFTNSPLSEKGQIRYEYRPEDRFSIRLDPEILKNDDLREVFLYNRYSDFLHSKIYLITDMDNGNSYLLQTSANCSESGLGLDGVSRNIEVAFFVHLDSKSLRLLYRIQRFLEYLEVMSLKGEGNVNIIREIYDSLLKSWVKGLAPTPKLPKPALDPTIKEISNLSPQITTQTVNYVTISGEKTAVPNNRRVRVELRIPRRWFRDYNFFLRLNCNGGLKQLPVSLKEPDIDSVILYTDIDPLTYGMNVSCTFVVGGQMDTEIASRELDFFVSINGENVDIKTIEEVSDGIHITVSLNATPRSFFILPTFYQPVEFTNKLKFITIKLSSEHAKDQFIKLCRTAFYGCSSAAIEDLNLMCETFLNIVCTLFGICLLANEKDANEKTLIFSSNDLLFILKNNWGTLQTLFQRVLTRSFHPNNMYLQKLLSKYSSFQTLQTNLNNGLAWLVHGNIIKSVNSQTYILDIHQLHHNIIQRFPSEWVLSKQRLIPWIGMDMLNYENIRRDFIMESICAIKTNDVKKVRFLANANLHKLHKINENLAFLCKRYVKRPMEKIEDFRELSHRSMILMKITLKWIVKRLMWRRVRRFAYDFENLLEFPSPEAITVKYVKTADHHVVIVKNSQIQPIKQIHDRFFLDLKVL